MGIFRGFTNEEIQGSLKDLTRQYFVGNLKQSQLLKFIVDEKLEIGITSYKTSQSEPAHFHSVAVEYQYVISGWTQYLDVETNITYEFKRGDFFAIMPRTSYAQRSKAGTEILFIKVPSINDKELVEVTKEVDRWLSNKLRTIRKDYFNDPDAPPPNSIRPAAAVAIKDETGRVLMVRRADSGKWTLPGGTVDFGESLHECALREIQEECGCIAILNDIVGTYTDPNIRVAYSDGEVRQEFTIVYAGTILGGPVVLDEESTEYRWVPLAELMSLPLAESQRKRLCDVVNYYTAGVKPTYCRAKS